MSAQPTTPDPLATPPAAVTYLDIAREVDPPEASEAEALRLRLETERSASSALVAALAELEQRLGRERQAREELQDTVNQRDEALAEAQEHLKAQHRDYARISYELNHVVRQLAEAQRPLWRRALRLRSSA